MCLLCWPCQFAIQVQLTRTAKHTKPVFTATAVLFQPQSPWHRLTAFLKAYRVSKTAEEVTLKIKPFSIIYEHCSSALYLEHFCCGTDAGFKSRLSRCHKMQLKKGWSCQQTWHSVCVWQTAQLMPTCSASFELLKQQTSKEANVRTYWTMSLYSPAAFWDQYQSRWSSSHQGQKNLRRLCELLSLEQYMAVHFVTPQPL